jgi:hypothetical protein
MKVIKGVLREELTNSLQMQKSYERELSKLPRGSLVKKKIKGRHYYYLVLREGPKVKFIYKGKLAEPEIQKYKKAKELSSELKKQIRFLRSALRGKEPV